MRRQDEYPSVEHILRDGRRFALSASCVTRIASWRRSSRCAKTSAAPADPESTYQALEKYGRDLTEVASQGSSSSVATRRFVASSRCSAHQEQPGPDRRASARRRARRRTGAADVKGGVPESLKQKRITASTGRAHRRRQVPRRVRGAPEGRLKEVAQRRSDPLHRRATLSARARPKAPGRPTR